MSNDKKQKVIVHDIRGQICPSCLLYTLREINEQRGALRENRVRIVIKTDNRNAISTIPDAVSAMGYFSSVEKLDGYYQIEITQDNM